MKKILPLSLLLIASTTQAANLSIDDFLQQVQSQNENFKGSQRAGKGAQIHSRDANIALMPSLFADYKNSKDKKPTDAPFFQGNETDANGFDVGLSEATSFGLNAKLTWTMTHVQIMNAPQLAVPDYHLAAPMLELSQSLLRNGFGSEVSAQRDLSEANNLGNSYNNSYQARAELVNSEIAYWRLAIARKTVEIQKDAFSRAEKILQWATKRVNLQLGERSDELQAQASLELSKLQLKAANDEVEAASIAFNSARNISGDQVPESLDLVESESLVKMEVPAREEMRLDVKAADEMRKVAVANAQLTKEKYKPDLKVFGSLAWTGRDTLTDASVNQAVQGIHPTRVIGVSFTTPLSFGLMSDTYTGTKMEQEGAELQYQNKLMKQEQDWRDLNTKLQEAKQRLALTRQLETVQKAKLENEQQRLLRGRTTTYQMLLFEQDFDTAQLQRVNTQAEVLRIIAQMKLFGGAL